MMMMIIIMIIITIIIIIIIIIIIMAYPYGNLRYLVWRLNKLTKTQSHEIKSFLNRLSSFRWFMLFITCCYILYRDITFKQIVPGYIPVTSLIIVLLLCPFLRRAIQPCSKRKGMTHKFIREQLYYLHSQTNIYYYFSSARWRPQLPAQTFRSECDE